MVTNEQFNNALKNLCTKQYDYMSEQYPASVDNIIFPKHSYKNEAKTLLKYFYQVKSDTKTQPYRGYNPNIIPNMVPIYIPWKLQDYIKFIRTKRDEMFPNNYKKKSRKFISHYPYIRSTLLSQYEKELYGK